jgi:hypothetical protein
MAILDFALLPACPVDRFVRLGAGLLARAHAEPSGHPALLVAGLEGETLLLGRHQRLASAISDRSDAIVRRSSGGRALQAGEGRIGIALALPGPGALTGEQLGFDKVLNRAVRGLLTALTRSGARGGAHYFGRDVVSAQGQELARVGLDGTPRAALFEAFVAHTATLAIDPARVGYPEHGDPRAAGPAPSTLAVHRGAPLPPEALLEAIPAGYAQAHGLTLQPLPLGALAETDIEPPAHEEESGLSSSGVADIPIGFVEALVAIEGHRITRARLRGDFLAPAFAMRQLEASLAGAKLNLETLGPLVDAAFHQPGAFSLGLRELRVLAEALLAAAASD